MKVITEERLKEILSCRVYPEWVIEGLIRSDLEEFDSIHEENGQIIVDELRPMSECPFYEIVLCKRAGKSNRLEGFLLTKGMDTSGFEGYVPMPIYRPKDGA